MRKQKYIKKNMISNSIFFEEIRGLITTARSTVVKDVDYIQVYTYFEIGRRIVEQEQRGEKRAKYGKMLIKELAMKLTMEFGDGFSKRNLEYMRKFYLTYPDRAGQIAQTLSAQFEKRQMLFGKLQKTQTSPAQLFQYKIMSCKFTLSWSHYVFLVGIDNISERSFYEIEAVAQNWSLRELKRQFNSSLYERLALSRGKKEVRKLSKKGQLVEKPHDLLKNPYVLEFLGLKEGSKYSESDLESAIIDKIEEFLLELGKGFLFESRQKRFTFDEDHFFVDLVFYNRLLRCYVLIDLKIGELTHQNLGQMQMYVNYFDRFIKRPEENPTIGIILCRKKTDALVEITLPKDANVHAKEYRLYLPSKDELRRKLLDWTS
ncbi:MAG: PDDEXK nuclease domain-containing protein [Candidatus Omnitrophota bacterium]|nr:PDDEXK nuclease domain-containing protein [Candidatus Omnitrophota bacterium]